MPNDKKGTSSEDQPLGCNINPDIPFNMYKEDSRCFDTEYYSQQLSLEEAKKRINKEKKLRETFGISINEEIYTKEGIKRVGDLNLCDMVLSYNFNKKEFCYKKLFRTLIFGNII